MDKIDSKKPGFSMDRRNFIAMSVAGLTSAAFSTTRFFLSNKIKAIAFDAFVIFDPRPVVNLVKMMYPEKGAELSETWRTKQFEYSWLRAAAGQYQDFWKVTQDALVFAAKKSGVTLTNNNKKQLMDQYLALDVWPDVLPTLQTFKKSGINLSFLSNMTTEMLNSCIKNSEIKTFIENVISTDNAKTYKPDPIAYQLGIDNLMLKKEEILFVAFAGWDASGSKWFGYPTFWLNRLGAPSEELDLVPDGVGSGMLDLANFVKQ